MSEIIIGRIYQYCSLRGFYNGKFRHIAFHDIAMDTIVSLVNVINFVMDDWFKQMPKTLNKAN